MTSERVWRIRPVVAGAVAVVLIVAGVVVVRAVRGGGVDGSHEPVADREFEFVSGLCGRIDLSPADVLLEPMRMLYARRDPARPAENETCTFEARSGTSHTLLTLFVGIADTPERARQVYTGIKRGIPAQGLAEHWDEGTIDSDVQSHGADVVIWALDGTLIVHVRFAWSSRSADEDRQTAAVLTIADEARTSLRR